MATGRRERKAGERRLKAAHFPTHKTLEGFDVPARPSVNQMLLCELARCEYTDRRENVLLVGTPGTGKTHWRSLWVWPPVRGAYRARCHRLTELAMLLMEARDERSLLALRAHQPDCHHQPAVRVLDRGAGLGAPHRCDPRPAHAPLPDHRG